MPKDKKPMDPESLAEIVEFKPMSLKAFEQLSAPLSWYFDPQYQGGENIPTDRGVLFVCNHSLYALADFAAILGAYRITGKPVRGLADRIHFKNPAWGGFLKRAGAVLGDPEICSALMKSGQNVVVFPGGAREVVKKRSEVYELVWKERVGFVRLALKHNYDIVPVGIVGGDEIYNFISDSDDYLANPIGKALDKSGFLDKFLRGKDELPPITRGVGLTMLPKPHRLYVSFGKPIRLADHVKGDPDKSKLLSARQVVADAINDLIEAGLQARKTDPKPTPFLRRLLQNL